ncbi:hypothetical protein M0R45_012826 [Rubus argutus]|uniref:Cohesin subunit SCC3/SA HEAT-repeats domain-containing protein n=1 Tax=Rubus argutus TaxID=59490 RepID=A0AAW1XGD6_RUBAR
MEPSGLSGKRGRTNDEENLPEKKPKTQKRLGFIKNGNYLSLLQKFEDDEAKLSSVIDILPHMNHEEWSKSNNKQGFQEVLKHIQRAFRKHNGKQLLRVCAMTYRWYSINCGKGFLRQTALQTLEELRSEVVANLTSADGVYEEHSLRRLSTLQNSGDVAIGSLYEHFIKKIVSTLETYKEQDSEMINASQCAFAFATLLETFVTRCQSEGNNWDELGTKVGTIGAKLWTLCKKVEKLGYPLNASDFQKFWELCAQQLSISDEANDFGNRDLLMLNAAPLSLSDTVYMVQDYLKPEIYDFVTSGKSKVAKHLMTFLSKTDENIMEICLKALKKVYQRHLDKLSFLDGVVLHFVSKLPPPEIQQIYSSVELQKENADMDKDSRGWLPYQTFIESLKILTLGE